jgi:spore germination protein KC
LIAAEARRNILEAKQVCQGLGVDVIHFRRTLRAYAPKAWTRMQDRWDEIFPTIPLDVSVHVSIMGVGEHK